MYMLKGVKFSVALCGERQFLRGGVVPCEKEKRGNLLERESRSAGERRSFQPWENLAKSSDYREGPECGKT